MGMVIKKSRTLAAAVLSSLSFALSAPAMAGPITLETVQVFDGSFFEIQNDVAGTQVEAVRLGRNRFGDYVVFQVSTDVTFEPLPGVVLVEERNGIVMQRVREAGPGAKIVPDSSQVLTDLTTSDAIAPDAAGDFIVYAANSDIPLGAPAVGAHEVWLRDNSTGQEFLVREATAGEISDVRIAGDWIVWNEGDVTFAQQVSSIGTGTPPTTVRGPVPATADAEIDSRFIVWTEQLSSFGFDAETRAQEIGGSSFFVTPDDLDDGFDEIDPATWGDLIAFGLIDQSTGLGDILLADILADTTQTFDLDLEGLSNLALTDEFLTFNALDGGGVVQAFLLRLADGELVPLTSGPEGGGAADVFGDLVTYASGQQLFVATIGEEVAEVPLPPTLALFGLGLAGLAVMRRRARTKPRRSAALREMPGSSPGMTVNC
jgi:hypothetical protein